MLDRAGKGTNFSSLKASKSLSENGSLSRDAKAMLNALVEQHALFE